MGRALPIFILKLRPPSPSPHFSSRHPLPQRSSPSPLSPHHRLKRSQRREEVHPSSLPSRKSKDEGLFLIYKYVSGGSLEYHLHEKKRRGLKEGSSLPWTARYKVALGIAEAAAYLHNGTDRCVVHRDIKPSNILLSSKKIPKLCDFGLATWTPGPSVPFLCKTVKGTFGEKELAVVKINANEVDIIADQLELDKKVAERTLREHKGDAVAAIRHLLR